MAVAVGAGALVALGPESSRPQRLRRCRCRGLVSLGARQTPEERGPEAERRRRHADLLSAAWLRSWPPNLLPSKLRKSGTSSGSEEAPHREALDDALGNKREDWGLVEGAVRCRFRVAYDGSCYHGWQGNSTLSGQTVSSVLESALSLLSGQLDVHVYGASRTDAGVHARGQAAHFDLTPEAVARRPNDWKERWEKKLNGGLLPSDIVVSNLQETRLDFDARRSASWKRYIYRLHLGPEPSDPLERLFRAPIREGHATGIGGDISRLQAAAKRFEGTHDFRAFSRLDKSRPNIQTLRTVRRIEVVDEGAGRCRIEVDLESAMWRMVRCMVGCIVAVAAGRCPASAIDEAFADPEAVVLRWEAAQAVGLCLERVYYDEEDGF